MANKYCVFCNDNKDLFKIKTKAGEIEIKNDKVNLDSSDGESHEIVLCSACLYQFDMACVEYEVLEVD